MTFQRVWQSTVVIWAYNYISYIKALAIKTVPDLEIDNIVTMICSTTQRLEMNYMYRCRTPKMPLQSHETAQL